MNHILRIISKNKKYDMLAISKFSELF